ncbi:MAG: alpha/beta hydrolase [Deinococcales bacterium]
MNVSNIFKSSYVRQASSPQETIALQTQTTPAIQEETSVRHPKKTQGHRLSFNKQLQRAILLAVAKTSPKLAQALTWHHFTRPRKLKAYQHKDLPQGATPLELKHRNASLKGYSWGNANKRIYLVHGWESHSATFKSFINPLVQLGFQVIAFDLPAHGHSSQQYTHFRDCTDALEKILSSYGEPTPSLRIRSAITVNTLAKNPQLSPAKLCLISPMPSAQKHVDIFSHVVGLPDYLVEKLWERLEQHMDMPLEDSDICKLINNIDTEGLVCHDLHDRCIPLIQGRVASTWQASFYPSRQLGHHRILNDPTVITKSG